MSSLKRYAFVFALLLAVVAHIEARPKIGLVLSGGGAKGAAEVGALKFIEHCGIPIDCIAGTSIGSVVGCLYAAGYKADELEQLFTNQEWLSLLTDWRSDLADKPFCEDGGLTYMFGFPFMNSSELHLFRGQRIHQMIDSLLYVKGCQRFDQLPVPFACVGAKLWSAQEVLLSEGNVADAVRSSIAIPLLLRPGVVDETRLVDGGMMNNMPIDIVREKMRADVVIVVDLTQEKPVRRSEENIWQIIRQAGSSFIDAIMGSNILSWILTRPDNTKYLANLHLLKDGDIYINPRLDGFSLFSFGNVPMAEMVERGVLAAKRHVTELFKLRLRTLMAI